MFNGDTKRQALLITFIFHIVFLLLYIPVDHYTIKIENANFQKPVEMSIVLEKPKPQPKAENKQKLRQKETKRVTNKPAQQVEKKIEAPKKQPGDRDNPEVGNSFSVITPKEAINLDLSGSVSVIFYIDEQGKPYHHKISKSSGYDILDEAFIRTVKNYYTFKPKQLFGQKKKGKIKLTHEF